MRYNIFRASLGTLSLRHGDRSSVYGNRFYGEGKTGTDAEGKTIGTGGIRIYGQDHKVFNNYFEGLTGTGFDAAIVIDGGDVDQSGALNAHWRVYRAQVVLNTLVNNEAGIEIGRNYSLAPVDSIVANNIVVSDKGSLFQEWKASNTKWNIAFPTGSAVIGVNRSSGEIKLTDPLLVMEQGGYKLGSGSPAINAAVGHYEFVVEEDEMRQTANHAGAHDEVKDPPAPPDRDEGITLQAVVMNGELAIEGTVSSGADQQVTVLVINPLGQIDFIDQALSGQDGHYRFTYSYDTKLTGEYRIRAGGTSITKPAEVLLTVRRAGRD